MAVPKNKVSKARRNKRRSAVWKLDAPAMSKCTNCGACARLCPMGAIDPKNVSNVPGTCIKCQRCVRKCTKGAKYFDDEAFLSHVKMLEQNFAEPKDNEVFL